GSAPGTPGTWRSARRRTCTPRPERARFPASCWARRSQSVRPRRDSSRFTLRIDDGPADPFKGPAEEGEDGDGQAGEGHRGVVEQAEGEDGDAGRHEDGEVRVPRQVDAALSAV